MNHFTIKDIENLCGIKAHTLRIWEQRYKQLFIPKRKESQHRVYDSNDLQELLRISFLYHNGYKISKIASLSPAQIQEEVAGIKPQESNYEIFVHQLIESTLQLDKENFDAICNEMVMSMGMEKSILNVFLPFLQRIGLLWMTNHMIPAQEHFSTHLIRKKIINATDELEINNKSEYNIVIFSPSGEQHEIPLLVVNYLLRKQGIRTTYFGVSVSTESLKYYSQHQTVSHFYSHLITHLDSSGVDSFICSLCKGFPDKTIVISGPASDCIQKKPSNLMHLNSLDEVMEFTHSLNIQQ
jgi:DNA-binding transcriptional MerR regulator